MHISFFENLRKNYINRIREISRVWNFKPQDALINFADDGKGVLGDYLFDGCNAKEAKQKRIRTRKKKTFLF